MEHPAIVTSPYPIVLGTTNAGKIEAFRRLLADLPVTLLTFDDLNVAVEVDETGTTFAENALIKARATRDASGLDALADDSGLCIDALGGEPGLHSARYGGLENSPAAQNLLVLERMRTVPAEGRGASFVSVVAFAGTAGTEWTADGTVRGTIADSVRGNNGFGYDPIFIPNGSRASYAELAGDEKDPISHRGKAIDAARYYLRRELGLLE